MVGKNVAGNFYNKYESLNPVARLLMAGFHNALDNELKKVIKDVGSIIDAGCGEGYVSKRITELTDACIYAFDISPEIIVAAKKIHSHPNILYSTKNIFDKAKSLESADLVLCLEVLEHLDDPRLALQILSEISNQYLILSVPNEPIWRVLNLARGSYIRSLGNTPGHLNHWTPKQFSQLVAQHFEIMNISKPFPWTMILCRKRIVT